MKMKAMLLLCAVLPLAACMNTRPVKDHAHFYLVTPSAGSVETLSGEPAIGMRPVALPEYLATRKIAIRQKSAEIVYNSFDLWGESLEVSVSRTLAARLAARIGRDRVDVFPWTDGVRREVELRVQFDHFEGTADGRVLVSGRYILASSADTASPTQVVPFDYQGKWKPADYATLATALGDALDGLAADILAIAGRRN